MPLPLQTYFSQSEIMDCDCYVADYTRQTDGAKGVEISEAPFPDIDFFHLKKINQHQHLPYLAVNLEKYPAFIEGIQNCECIFASVSDVKKPWLLMLETKYCESPDKIEEYMGKTALQMQSTLGKLIQEKLINHNQKKIFFCYSAPKHSEYEPFYSFVNTPEFMLRLQEQGITFFGFNTILIATPTHLFAPHLPL